MPLMFDKNKVLETSHPLIRLLRLIFYKAGTTLDNFSALYSLHGKRLGISTSVTHTNHGNARKALHRDDEMTFRFFYYILLNILRLDIVEVKIVFRSEEGELITIGSADPVDNQDEISKTLRRLTTVE